MKHIAIIGGGIVGLTTAYFMRKEGFEVTVFDKDDFNRNCSTNNAGLLVPSHYIPLAAPGVVTQGIAWSFSPGSPFSLSLNKSMFRWAYHFMRSANRHHTQNSYELLYELNRQSLSLFEDMALHLGFYLRRTGLTLFFRNRKSRDAELKHIHYADTLKIPYALFSQAEINQLEPDMEIEAYGALHYGSDASIDPENFLKILKGWLVENGVVLKSFEELIGAKTAFGQITSVYTKNSEYIADEYVVTGGKSSDVIFKKLGLQIPLQAGKGYSFDLASSLPLKHPAILVDGRVAVSLLPGKTRISGTMQIGSEHHSIKNSKIKGIVQTVNEYFPGNKIDFPSDSNIWVGHRPCSADGLPYIGRSSKYSNLLIGTGHAMMGVSLSAITGKLLSQLAMNSKALVDIEKLFPERFHKL
jgi:D-amino-acid dehydrogenase